LLPSLTIRKLPARNRFDIGAATTALHRMGRRHPLAIALAAMAKHIIVIRLPQAKLPST
jgi:hypothetical protein